MAGLSVSMAPDDDFESDDDVEQNTKRENYDVQYETNIFEFRRML